MRDKGINTKKGKKCASIFLIEKKMDEKNRKTVRRGRKREKVKVNKKE